MHIVTVGTAPVLVRNLWSRIQIRGGHSFSHIAHPTHNQESWTAEAPAEGVSFFRDHSLPQMPSPDRELLSSLERTGVPTIHNMILSDRVVSKLPYAEALAYATFLARKLIAFYEVMKPTVIIGGFDALHGSLGFAVAKSMGIPWYVLSFNSLPYRQVAFGSDLSPASKVIMEPGRASRIRSTADRLLKEFESRRIEAAAYIPPKLFTPAFIIRRVPEQIRTLTQTLRRGVSRDYLRFTELPGWYSVWGLFREAMRLRKNSLRLPYDELLSAPVNGRYAFFGLHMQPESSIDVFAHFFSNQVHVVELMSRSLPPSHTLLVKLHKSDVPNYSRDLLAKLARFPGVRLVSPYADTFEFIKRADLILSIQGTMGLEGALLGKPVIMFGDSPARVFPSVSTIGRTPDLPALVRRKLGEARPNRAAIVDAYSTYLETFYPASGNDWRIRPTDDEIDGYVRMFELLENHVRSNVSSFRAVEPLSSE